MKIWIASVTVALSAALAAPSHAGTQQVDDWTEDVYSVSLGDIDPFIETADITSTTFTYSRKLTVTAEVRNLSLAVDNYLLVNFKDPQGRLHVVNAIRLEDGTITTQLERGEKELSCAITAVFDEPNNIMKLSLKSSCFGAPTWIKIGANVHARTETNIFIDDARFEGLSLGAVAKRGPKLMKG